MSAGRSDYIVERYNSVRPSGSKLLVATVTFAVLLYGFWRQVQSAGIAATLGGHVGSAFACFALMLAVLWYAGFGIAEWPASSITSRAVRVLLPTTLAIPYAVFAFPRGEFHWIYFVGRAALPVALAAILEFAHLEPKFAWQDAVVLCIIAAVLEARVFA